MTQQEIALHKKRFGQFFSGKEVSDLLFSLLPEHREWTSVVDPMAGIGDMLVSVREHTKNHPILLGIEIDEAVAKKCAERVPEAVVVSGDAFKSNSLITTEGFDLVITNPPYVRYQLQDENNEVMPSAQEIRESLIQQLKRIPYLTEEEKNLLIQLAKNYSGLSDMAVPAWLLCAALVKKDGYLAVVVPETWLNRDYAVPIQYLLLKCFRIETVAIDTNGSWFPEAQVKTCLVVARRINMRSLNETEKYVTRIVEANQSYTQTTTMLFPHLRGIKEAKKWSLPEDKAFFTSHLELPHELIKLIKDDRSIGFVSLSELGIECGQGLRTGANDFFYVEIEKDEGKTVIVRSKEWDQGGKEYRIEKEDIILALQNRGEIEGLIVSPEKLKKGVVYPQRKVQGDLLSYIDSAEEYRDVKGRRFKDYSAVSPNEKKDGDRIIREWYRLPKMANRHLPNLCLTRVSAKTAECLYVEQHEKRPITIDANMVTLWGKNTRTIEIVFAMLNSTWSKLSLELICTVMGGGALKIEASHLKKLLLPKLDSEHLEELECVGKELIKEKVMTENIQEKIDCIMASPFEDKEVISRMRKSLERKYNERSTRK